MTSSAASEKKLAGHANEQHFADAIGGRVHRGSHTDKKDVMDRFDRSHSVKAGTWWQIFLYSQFRLKTNTMFRGIGKVAPIMVNCLHAYPDSFDEYKSNKAKCKEQLREPMRQLLCELQKPDIFAAFMEKSMFDGGNAEYLSIYPGPAKDPPEDKCFHIFHKNDVCRILASDITLKNSQARKPGDTPEQKVVFCSTLCGKQIGEVEDRHDSLVHYKSMKFRLNGELVFRILQNDGLDTKNVANRVTAYGVAAGGKNRF